MTNEDPRRSSAQSSEISRGNTMRERKTTKEDLEVSDEAKPIDERSMIRLG